ncbi:hypothetical protein TNCV_1991091 [Trichonephila clavipes]|nr:hypothetical protein TNCV_1991091 [Trichonephila clavipes]
MPPTSSFHSTIGGGDVSGSASRVDWTMDVLRTDHSAINGVECDPSLPCAQFACPHMKWCTKMDVIDHVDSTYPPAFNGHISVVCDSSLVSCNTTTDLPER